LWLQGWFYTVGDSNGDTMPGAPVFVHVVNNGEVVEVFEQVERSLS
jgi:hypothetical protein